MLLPASEEFIVTLLTTVASVVPFTSTLMVQEPTAKAAFVKATLVEPAVGAHVPPQVFDAFGVAATCIPLVNVSVKLELMVTMLGLVTLKVRVDTPVFKMILLGLKPLVIEGGSKTVILAVIVC